MYPMVPAGRATCDAMIRPSALRAASPQASTERRHSRSADWSDTAADAMHTFVVARARTDPGVLEPRRRRCSAAARFNIDIADRRPHRAAAACRA